jgi:hypothetical protein
MTSRARMSHRKPPPLTAGDVKRAQRLLPVAVDATSQLRGLLRCNDLAVNALDEVDRLLELVGVHVAAEVEIAQETRRSA